MLVLAVTFLPQLTHFKPTTKLTSINWGSNRNRAANPLQKPEKVLTHLLINFSTQKSGRGLLKPSSNLTASRV